MWGAFPQRRGKKINNVALAQRRGAGDIIGWTDVTESSTSPEKKDGDGEIGLERRDSFQAVGKQIVVGPGKQIVSSGSSDGELGVGMGGRPPSAPRRDRPVSSGAGRMDARPERVWESDENPWGRAEGSDRPRSRPSGRPGSRQEGRPRSRAGEAVSGGFQKVESRWVPDVGEDGRHGGQEAYSARDRPTGGDRAGEGGGYTSARRPRTGQGERVTPRAGAVRRYSTNSSSEDDWVGGSYSGAPMIPRSSGAGLPLDLLNARPNELDDIPDVTVAGGFEVGEAPQDPIGFFSHSHHRSTTAADDVIEKVKHDRAAFL